MKKSLLLTFLIVLSTTMFADGILISWGPKDLKGMTQEKFEDAKSWTVDLILEKTLNVDNWPDTYLLLVAASKKKDSLVDKLINLLENNIQTKLAFTTRLIIWERVISGDILFEGKGLQVNDDLFTTAGRANWLLRNITHKNFGVVNTKSTIDYLKELKEKWEKWRKGETIEEFKNPYDTDDKGLDEVNSIEAFEAIIISLKTSAEKELLIKSCLKNLYNLDKLPEEKDSPARLCNPDSYSHTYLAKLSGIKDEHDYAWWLNWWTINKNKLIWNKQLAKFDIHD